MHNEFDFTCMLDRAEKDYLLMGLKFAREHNPHVIIREQDDYDEKARKPMPTVRFIIKGYHVSAATTRKIHVWQVDTARQHELPLTSFITQHYKGGVHV